MPDFIFHSRYITHSKTTPYTHSVVIHSVKLKILKANHNCKRDLQNLVKVVIHSVKLKILKANHNVVIEYAAARHGDVLDLESVRFNPRIQIQPFQ